MKLLLALLAVAVVTAHWTHDDSLAREIGPPPGEEDVDVAALSDELISEKEGSGEDEEKMYRITIGTSYDTATEDPQKQFSWYHGASSSPIEFRLKGAKGWGDERTFIDPGDFEPLRYYNGPFMDYDMSAMVAPTLLPGLIPVILPATILCSGLDDFNRVKDCQKKTSPLDATEELDWCQPNTKTCKAKLGCKVPGQEENLDCPGLGYACPPPQALPNDPDNTSVLKMGLIQRGQINYKDVGDITEVQAQSAENKGCKQKGLSDWECSSPWWPKFIKVNSNSPTSGVGDGIYYIHPMPDLHTGIRKVAGGPDLTDDMYIVAKPGEVPVEATTTDMDAASNAELVKCVAQTCEEEMDAKFGMDQYDFSKTM